MTILLMAVRLTERTVTNLAFRDPDREARMVNNSRTVGRLIALAGDGDR